MKLHTTLAALGSIAILFASCASTKGGSTSAAKKADALFNQGNYNEAMAIYKTIDSLSRDSHIYYRMSQCELHNGNYIDGAKYASLSNVTDSVMKENFNELFTALKSHQSQLSAIENNTEYFGKLYGKKYVMETLAGFYSYTSDPKMIDLYQQIEDAELRNEYFAPYFSIAKSHKDEKELTSICNEALKANPKEIVALKYLGTQTYNKAEASYKAAMDEYNKKKNATTYAYLCRDLKKISAIYIESKNYFEKVRNIDKADQGTIKYLINIYNRLDQPAKAKSLQKLLK